jgi:hypothetical protein
VDREVPDVLERIPRSHRPCGAGFGLGVRLSTESQFSAGGGASEAAAGTAGLRTISAVSFSICLGMGMRQVAGVENMVARSVSEAVRRTLHERPLLAGDSRLSSPFRKVTIWTI